MSSRVIFLQLCHPIHYAGTVEHGVEDGVDIEWETGWRVQIAIQGVRQSRIFSAKDEAASWVAQRETEIRTEKTTGVQRGRTVSDAFRRYEKEVLVHKCGGDKEAIRMAAIGRMVVDGVQLKDWKLTDVTSDVLNSYLLHEQPTCTLSDSGELLSAKGGQPLSKKFGAKHE